jgi:hypothetical protein
MSKFGSVFLPNEIKTDTRSVLIREGPGSEPKGFGATQSYSSVYETIYSIVVN